MTTFLRNARVLRRMTGAHIAMSLTYRGEWLVYMAANISVPIISLLIWRTALANGAQLPIDEEFVTTYFVLLSVVTMATSSWLTTFLARDIRLGKLSSWMVRPASLLLNFVANNLSEKVMKTFALLPMIGVLWWVFHDSMHFPAGGGHLTLFATSVVLAAVLVFTIDILVASLAFWMDDVAALHQARQLIANVLSGSIVPLALMPDWSRGFVDIQPFRYTVSFPVEILAGDLSGAELLTGMSVQLGYVLVFGVFARLVWTAGLRGYSAVGA
ncbi:ABC transporter permease [Actinopolymorpha pittospori]